MQRYGYGVNILMDVSANGDVTTIQHYRCYANISMDVSAIANVTTTQHHGFYASISMSASAIVNVITMQLGTSCSFDSPGLARNEPTPGKRSQGDSTP